MCIAAPGKIVQIRGRQADVEYVGSTIRTALIADHEVRAGDYVLVQMGIIVKILSRREAKSIEKAWNERTILSA